MTQEHTVISRAREIVAVDGHSKDELAIVARVEAVYRALAEITGMRMPVNGVDDSDYFGGFLDKTFG